MRYLRPHQQVSGVRLLNVQLKTALRIKDIKNLKAAARLKGECREVTVTLLDREQPLGLGWEFCCSLILAAAPHDGLQLKLTSDNNK